MEELWIYTGEFVERVSTKVFGQPDCYLFTGVSEPANARVKESDLDWS